MEGRDWGLGRRNQGVLSFVSGSRDIIQNYSSEFNPNESYQALVSLERILLWNNYGLSNQEKRNLISEINPTPFIEPI
ncbi:hypothetical protein [Nostoc sp.]|uniref:hypothetical protein n=1 Tax=Nostoc sp. TaxID=1180 RepID=UPI002FF8795F